MGRMVKTCTKCGEEKELSEFHLKRSGTRSGPAAHQPHCKECRKNTYVPWKHERRRSLHRRYHLTEEQYDQMLEDQKGVCAICGNTCRTGQRLVVDHDHVSGKVRALLCRNCNLGIGHLDDSSALVERALNYLNLWNEY